MRSMYERDLNGTRDVSGMNPYYILLGVFISCLVIAQFLATKLTYIQLPHFGRVIFPAGVLAYALTYLCTDVISEVWGRHRATATVIVGFIASLIALILVWIAIHLPTLGGGEEPGSFDEIANKIIRVIVASMSAYLISQFNDVWLFHTLKRITRGKALWMRNLVSTSVSQFIDSSVFIFLAFYGDMGLGVIWSLIIGQFAIKFLIAVLDTPLVYLFVWLIRRRSVPGTLS